MSIEHLAWKDQFSEPVLRYIRGNPGTSTGQIFEQLALPGTVNGLRENQLKHLKTTGKIKGGASGWYIEELVK